MPNNNSISAKFVRMTSAPVERLVVSLAVPSILIMLISSIYNMADTYFVGQIGTAATGGVGISFALMAVIQAFGFFFGHGSGNFISRQLGAKNFEIASRMAAVGATSSFLCGAVIAVSGLAFLEPLARLLGATDTILPHAKDYLFYILIGAPWMTTSFTLNNLLRFQGSAFYGMIGMISGAALNLILDPIFIFVFDMGVSGAALATMLSQFVSFCLLFIGSTRPGNVSIKLSNFSPSWQAYREIIRGGSPSLCRQALASIGAICLNQAAGNFGDAAIAAMSIVQRVAIFAYSTILGWGQGFQPVCGFNYGARNFGRVKTAFWFCVKFATIALTIMAGTGIIFAPEIIALFRRDDPHVIEIGSLALRFQAGVMPLFGWIVLNNMMLQTIGKALKASFLAFARQGLFMVPLLLILTPRLGVLGVQLAQPIADVFLFISSLPLGLGILKEMTLGIGPEQKSAPEGVIVLDADDGA